MTESKNTADFYKDTVFLPKTDFPMRGELPKKEPEILARWQAMDFYRTLRKASAGKKKWILHWGPPYANGHAHMGHAFTKTLKDVVNRSYQMLGHDAPLVPGWDCHGLPIEWKIEEKYRAEGKNKDDVDKIAFRAECRAFAKEWADIQSKEFQRLGVCADWENPYLTMTNGAEAQIVREIHKFLLNGSLYRGAKPVMWSVVEKTALAEAEVEYHEHKSVTVWAKFPILHTSHKPLENASVVIWTTTPWTLPSNRAIAFGPEIDYALYEVRSVAADSKAKAGDRLLLAIKLAEDVKAKAKIEEWEEEVTFKGRDLDGIACAHPLHAHGYDFSVPLLSGDFVTEDTGTGFVHIAPGHGEDDYYLYLKHFGAKDIPDNVTDDGKFREHVPLFAGKEIYTQKGELGDGNFAVLKAFDEAGALLAKGSLKHEYPHSWRSKAPVIFRTTPQWFIALDDDNKLRQTALKAITETRWVPPQGENRIRAMIEQRPDWCISRQRAWGVPIALFIDKVTGEALKDQTVLTRIGDTFEAEGADAWWARDAQYFLGDKYKAENYDQIFDIVDVWFESGCTHAFVLEARGLPSPADLYLEGSDQHRGWFHSSLLESCGTRGHAPYKAVLTHGFVLDEKGYKMSKSLGNVVDPNEMIAQYGADIVRLWALLSDYKEDIRIGKDTIKNTADIYRRLRNIFRFLLGALDGFTEAEKVDDYAAMPELERLTLHQLAEMDAQVRGYIENYEFSRLAHALHNFCVELSGFYLDIRKDRLYCDRPDLFERRACRTVLSHIFECLCTWLAPLLAFTADEAWSHRPDVFGKEESVHLRTFPVMPKEWRDDALAAKWETISKVREMVTGSLELLRKDKTIGSSLEAVPHIAFTNDQKNAFSSLTKEEIAEVFITSSVVVSDQTLDDITIINFLASDVGQKCIRCWKILPEVGTDKEHKETCIRCANAVRHIHKKEAA
jgi:isoleucyl-tRNA synthetase